MQKGDPILIRKVLNGYVVEAAPRSGDSIRIADCYVFESTLTLLEYVEEWSKVPTGDISRPEAGQ